MSESKDLETAALWLRGAERIVVFTGAGISAESGIATFRDEDGFWQRFPPEQFATWEGLLELLVSHPPVVADFLLELLAPIARAEPNPGHLALARMQSFREMTVITQNVDGLHQAAGSQIVKEIHGTMFEIVRRDRQWLGSLSRVELAQVVEVLQEAKAGEFQTMTLYQAIKPILGFGPSGFYRPNLVLFGDDMNEPDWTDSLSAARNCDVFLTVGTSGLVYPAATLPLIARTRRAKCIAIDPSENSGDLWLKGNAGNVLPDLVKAAFPS